MEYPVLDQGKIVGCAELEQQGLYWVLTCSCELCSEHVERLYSGQRSLAVLERSAGGLSCRRRLSRASTPELPPQSGCLTLRPYELWQGELAGVLLAGLRDGAALLFPYDRAKPCPCEPLVCFFEIVDGFWRIAPETYGLSIDG